MTKTVGPDVTRSTDSPDALAAWRAHPPAPGRYHEVMTAAGELRPTWQELLAQFGRLGPAQRRHRQELLQRQIQDNGVTYNVYADAKGADRPWELDLLPQLIGAAEWRALAAGIAQRAGLLDAVLADLYGPQQLLREGLLPPDLVFGHNNFLWPCQGIVPPGGRFLHVYAADLARAPDGRWWVLADRTQCPSGAGYALENRQILLRTVPDWHHALGVQPVAGFFRALRQQLTGVATDGEAPLAVVLTPGRYNETYFEHLYLARHLGLPLVEGQDLTVRGDTLYLKAVTGLRRVHALLRRLDDDFCDPLELRSDSALGIPGLLNVVRAGRVLVSNALGAGVVESPGLLGFLPAISRRLTGADLLLPQIATWWCGEAGVLDAALARLDALVIKPAFPSQSFEPVFAANLDAAARAELAQRLRALPGAYVAQEQVRLSQAPVLTAGGRLEDRAIGMRVFALATPDGYRVLPGGLTRVAAASDAGVVSMQRGGASKDTWVLAEGAATAEPPARDAGAATDIRRHEDQLPSRVVENLFWFGRYSERCDTQARVLRAALLSLIDQDSPVALATTLAVAQQQGLLPPAEAEDGAVALPARLLGATLDPHFGNSLPANLQRLFSAAAPIRGRLSQENWLAVAALARQGRGCAGLERELGEALAQLGPLVTALTALAGFALDDMTRDVGWRFLMLGRRIERLQFFAGAVAAVLASPGLALREERGADRVDTLESLLALANSLITYRTRYRSLPELLPVLDLLLLDPQNPHSLAFQVANIEEGLEQLREEVGHTVDNPLARAAVQLRALNLAVLEPALLGEAGRDDALDGLVALLQELAAQAGVLSDRLGLRYFAHADLATSYGVGS